MLPILGIIAGAIGSAITAGEAVTIGASIGAATVAGANLLSKNQKSEVIYSDDDDELDELIEALKRQRRMRKKV